MASQMEQCGSRRTRRGYAQASAYHRWLKVSHNRYVRRQIRRLIFQGQDPVTPKYRGWET